ncbi:hypothetical protein PENANT_c019G05499 [Penicillium antarcticum]|uniref:2-methylcitrate dehydratase n=1 Tax=Penicillium antarcticum TaxID=416450 RepID=A0A1V6Q0V4_9EURO|nr:uncharacterized protein N7508_001128 [Penicillium antarcticum]KAJ5316620.1 hypothetical protein N7508_001128 [Penicillium antarcticum]OQD82855.1 hypothetical protein PENANT_c019G05499 [Penicillium antarcticum]
MSTPYDKSITELVDYVYNHTLDETEEKIWTSARTALLDAMACAISTATTSPEALRLISPVVDTVVPDGFPVPGTKLVVDPVAGAFGLGVLIRYLDFNDAVGGVEWGHPSDNLGAILPVMDWLARSSASGQRVHKGPPLTMQTLLIALVKAYEIQGCYQMQNAFNAYGIDHVVLVKLASAAVVSWLLGLSQEQAMATISHVWMDGHPNRVYRSGANTIPRKGWAAGEAARRAVQLSLIVGQGQPGSPGALSAKPWGFWERTFGEVGFKFPRPFGSWTVQNVLFKIMPVEGHAISAVEAAILHARLFRQKGLSDPLGLINRIDLRTTAAAYLIVNKKGTLHNAADRDHCIQYVVALAFLKEGPPEAGDYLDKGPWATSEELNSLRDRIVVNPDSKLTRDYFDLNKKSIGAGMTVHLADGSTMPEILIEYPVGHARNPQTPAAIQKKFFHSMGQIFSAAEIGRILGAVRKPDLPVSVFVDLFVPTGKAKL